MSSVANMSGKSKGTVAEAGAEPESERVLRAAVSGEPDHTGLRWPITPEQVVLAGSTYEADYNLAGATLRQCADEIDVVISAIANGLDDVVIQTVLTGIAQRMVMAARVASESEASNG